MTTRAIVALSWLVSFLTASTASADDPRKQRAEPIFQEALRLHDANRDAEAIAKYEEAYAIYPSPNVLFWMARCEELLGRKLDALRDYRQATSNGLFDPMFMEKGRERIRELESQVSHIDVVGPERMRATIDGVAVAKGVDVLPGHHLVAATLDDRTVTRDVTANAGSPVRVDLTDDLALRPVEPKSDGAQPPVRPEQATPRHTTSEYVLVGGLIAAGAASVVASLYFASASQDNHDTAVKYAFPGACSSLGNPACQSITSKNDDAGRDRTLSIVTGVAGGALLAGAAVTGIVFFVLPKSPRIQGLWVAPSVVTLRASIEAGIRF